MTHTDGGRVSGMVSQEKWDKTKQLIQEMVVMVEQDCLPLARLLQIWGFLMYVVHTFPRINPYTMKGLHLTIDSWRPFRGTNGFKLKGKELENALAWGLDMDMHCRRAEDKMEEKGGPHVSLIARRGSGGDEPPMEVKPVARFINDLTYLTQLTQADTPPKQLYQGKHVAALFVIGDMVVLQYGLDYKSGVWSQHWRD